MMSMPTEGCPNFVEWAPNSRHFVRGSGSPINESPASVFLWEVGRNTPIRRLEGLTKWPTAAGFSPDGFRVAAGDWGGHLVIWEITSGRVMHAITAHTGIINTVAYPRRAVSSRPRARTRPYRLWDSVTGQERATFQQQGLTFRSLAFSPSGRTLVAVGSYGDFGDRGRAVTWSVPDLAPSPNLTR